MKKLSVLFTASLGIATLSSIALAQTSVGQTAANNKTTAVSAQLNQLKEVIDILQERIQTLEQAPNDVPSGAVMAFDLNNCPEGWSDYADASGRSIVGAGSFLDTKPPAWPYAPLTTVEFPKGEKGGHVFRQLTTGMQHPHQHVVPFGENAGHNGYNPRWGYAKDTYPYSQSPNSYTNQNGTQGHDNDNEWMMTSPIGALSAVKIRTTTTNASSSSSTILKDTSYNTIMGYRTRAIGDQVLYHKYKTMEGTWYYQEFLNTMNPYIVLKYCKKD